MTYVPPERDGEELDQTQKLPSAPAAALPSVGNGDLGGQAAPFQPEASPTVPFASDRGEAEPEPPGPVESKPRRDRIVFQLIWEVVLLLLAANALFMLYRRRDEVFGDAALGDALDEHLTLLAPVLLIVVAMGLSLRFGAVNLAVPTLAILAASAPGVFVGSDPWIGLGLTAAAAVAAALVLVLLVLALRVPAWLAGIAVAAGTLAAVPPLTEGTFGYRPTEPAVWDSPGGAWMMAGAAVVAVGGGLLGLVPAVRDRMSAVKDALDGSGERGPATVFAFTGAVLGSSLLAACAGFLLTVFRDPERGEGMFALSGLPFGYFVSLELFVFIAVFLAGTSFRGRRGGVFGGLIAVGLIWAVYMLWGSYDTERLEQWSGLLGFGMLVLGLVVAAALDRLGRPKDRPEEEPVQEIQPFEPQQNTSLFEPESEPEASATPR